MAYPTDIDSFSTKTDDVDDVLAEHINTIQDAIEAVETELGTDPAGSVADVKTRLLKSLTASGKVRLNDGSELTISSGSITVTNNLHAVDTEADAATDDLTTIVGGSETGDLLVLWPAASARNVVIKHGAGNIVCKGANDITLDLVSDFAILLYNATTTNWRAFGISNTVISGSGTEDRLTKWTDSSTIGDASILDSVAGGVLNIDASLTAGRTLTIADRDTTLNGDITGGGVVATGGYTLTAPKTGTAVVGTGTADYLAQFADANEIESSGIETANVVQKGDSYLEVTEQGATPSTPAAGLIRLYAKTDGKLYFVDDTGTETEVGSGSGGGGSFHHYEEGTLAVATGVCYWVATSDGDFSDWTITCKSLGSASSTIIDINLNGTTIFTTQANRPTLAYNDADSIATGTPDVTSYLAGDIISLDIDQVATGASGLSVNSAIGASGGTSPFDVLLDETVGAGGAASFSVSGIGADYKYIEIIITCRAATAQSALYMEFNGDTTAANYYYSLSVGGTGAVNTKGALQRIGYITESTGTANYFSENKIKLFNYANTATYKTVSNEAAFINTDSAIYNAEMTEIWKSTNAITAIVLKPASGNFAQYSRCLILGWK